VQAQIYRWIFDHILLDRITLDMDYAVITRYGTPEGGAKGYNAAKPEPVIAPPTARIRTGLLRVDCGFYDDAILTFLQGRHIDFIISAKLHAWAATCHCRGGTWWSVGRGLEMGELNFQAQCWSALRRIIVVRQHSVQRMKAIGKTMSLFADDPDQQGWLYGAMVSSLNLHALEIWRSYRGQKDCENRIKETKEDLGLDNFIVKNFYVTEATLGFAMLAYNPMSLLRHAVL
jgi:hypothetical protein